MFDPYLANTWAGGAVVALVAGIVGVFVVLRGDSFLAHAIPQGSFAGAAVAAALGASTTAGMGIAAVLTSLLVSWLGKHDRRDVVIALLLSFLLAGGAVALSLQGGYANRVYALLFGQILSISSSDLMLMIGLATGVIVVVLFMVRPLLAASVLPDSPAARGWRVSVVEFVFTLVLAATATASVPLVGALLLFSLLVAPPAAACTFCRTPGRALLLSCLLCLLCMWGAIALSVITDLPVGFFVASLATLTYVVVRPIHRRSLVDNA